MDWVLQILLHSPIAERAGRLLHPPRSRTPALGRHSTTHRAPPDGWFPISDDLGGHPYVRVRRPLKVTSFSSRPFEKSPPDRTPQEVRHFAPLRRAPGAFVSRGYVLPGVSLLLHPKSRQILLPNSDRPPRTATISGLCPRFFTRVATLIARLNLSHQIS